MTANKHVKRLKTVALFCKIIIMLVHCRIKIAYYQYADRIALANKRMYLLDD